MKRALLATFAGLALVASCSLDRFGTGAGNDPDASLGGSGGTGGIGGSGGLGGVGNTGGGFPDVATGGTGGIGGTGGTAGTAGAAGSGGTAGAAGAGGSAGAAGAGGSAGAAGAGGSAGAAGTDAGIDAGPPKPTDYTGLVLWLRADAGVTAPASSVSDWLDQSGLGNNYTQTNPTLRPALVPAQLNGKAVVRFAATPGLPDLVSGSGLTFTTGMTIFLVLRMPAPPNKNQYFDVFNNATTGSKFRLGFTLADSLRDIYFGTGETGFVRSVTPVDAAAHLYTISWSGSAPNNPAGYTAAIDDVAVAVTGAPSGPGASTANTIGSYSAGSAAFALIGDVAELVVYGRQLNAVERAQLGASLRSSWGLP